jgi:hypothetical protein
VGSTCSPCVLVTRVWQALDPQASLNPRESLRWRRRNSSVTSRT